MDHPNRIPGIYLYAGMCRLSNDYPARHIDLLITEYYKYPFALLYLTGNKEFNEGSRSYARSKDYTLNQEGIQSIRENGGYIHGFSSEKQIFHFPGIEYIKPQNRTENMKFAKKLND